METQAPAPEKLLSAADILAASDLTFVDEPVPEWGGSIRLQAMTADQVLKFIDANKGEAGQRTANARLIATCAVDQMGRRLFTEAEVEALMGKSFSVVARLAKRAMVVNGLDRAAAPTEAEKNVSGEAAIAASPTA